jgi:hypothetical protein
MVRASSGLARSRAGALGFVLAWVAAVVALGLRYHLMGDGDAEADFFGAYVVQARGVLDGHLIIDPFRGPLYPITLALAGRVLSVFGAGLFETGIVLSALGAGVTLLLFRHLLGRIFGPGTALVGMLLLATNPVFVRYSYTAGTDMFFVMLAVAAVTVTLAGERFSWRRAVAAGAVFALAYLTRYAALALVAGACVAVLLCNVWTLAWKRRVAAAAVMTAAFALLITPWGIYRQVEKGSFFYSENHVNVLYSLLPPGSDTDRITGANVERFHNVFDVLAFAPATFARQLPGRAWHQLASDASSSVPWPVMVLAIAGVATLFLRRPARRETGWYLIALSFFAVLLLVFYNRRFGLFLIPAYVTLAVRGAAAIGTARRSLLAALTAVAVVAVGFSVRATVDANRVWIHGGDPTVRAMGEWFRANVPSHMQGGRVVARKPAFAYFAGLEPVPLPVLGSHQELLEYLERHDANYLFFSYIALRTRPQLAYLADVGRAHPGLERLTVTPTAVLYRVEAPARR